MTHERFETYETPDGLVDVEWPNIAEFPDTVQAATPGQCLVHLPSGSTVLWDDVPKDWTLISARHPKRVRPEEALGLKEEDPAPSEPSTDEPKTEPAPKAAKKS